MTRPRLLLPVLASLLLVPAAGQQPRWEARYSSNATATIRVVGDVNDVLQGRVKATGFRLVDLRTVLFAAGAGTVGKPDSIGEMQAIPGRTYVKSVAPPYPVESSSRRFSTPFCWALPKGALPRQVLRVWAPGGITMEQIHKTLAARYCRTFALAGLARFHSVSTTTLKRGPYYGEPISTAENRDRYFHPVQTRTNRSGILFGVVVNTDRPEPAGDSSALERRMVYVNYADKNRSALQSHSHVLFLTGNPDIPSARAPRAVLSSLRRFRPTEISHLLTQSTVTDALLLVYDVRRLTGR
jgi:hypothetical protein